MSYVPIAIVITFLSGLIFVCIQQTIRLGANDQPLELAQNLASGLATKNALPTDFPVGKSDISKSLTPVFMVFDSRKKMIGTTAKLNNKPAQFPTGVLDKAKEEGLNMVTWQPQKGVRLASVSVYFKEKSEGYVVVARSLVQTERLEDMLQTLVGIGWLVTLFAFLLSSFLLRKLSLRSI